MNLVWRVVHFLDFTNPRSPRRPRFRKLRQGRTITGYRHVAAPCQGGLRVVDISGELMGDIYARKGNSLLNSSDPDGFAPTTNVWGTMPYKGLIYFSDMNNGLWAIRLEDETMGTN